MRRNQEQLALQRKKEEDLRKQINGIDPVEAERRAKHMREQRDMLLQKKKEERERKVKIESERRAKADAEMAAELPQAVQRIKQQKADVRVRTALYSSSCSCMNYYSTYTYCNSCGYVCMLISAHRHCIYMHTYIRYIHIHNSYNT